ncbi:alpha/beta hydrolase [Rhabdochromatium marinum]|uniref:alpha/beta hydrolase n=1 Tax=Rhabdochromatium marinum TaxID=48729 RepID=UPI001905EDCB|nr:alpha/beta hydrolase [Rhabdochromatium marinum]MBK1650585.1 hypothetical protein [Rhabdochromatium marinum]
MWNPRKTWKSWPLQTKIAAIAFILNIALINIALYLWIEPPSRDNENINTSGRQSPIVINGNSNVIIKYHENNSIVVRVFYGTDRKPIQGSSKSIDYGPEMGVLDYGIADVSIPKEHKLGEMESPTWWKFEFKEDPGKHITLINASSINKESFYQRMKKEMNRMSKDEVFVFIHGFNVTFKDSIRRTAQLAYDLHYPGIPVAYSWPSQGSPTPVGYATDKERSEWSYPHLKLFLLVRQAKLGASCRVKVPVG